MPEAVSARATARSARQRLGLPRQRLPRACPPRTALRHSGRHTAYGTRRTAHGAPTKQAQNTTLHVSSAHS